MTCLMALLLLAPGCAVPYKVECTETGAPQYRKVEINYELDHSCSALASKSLQPIQTASATSLDDAAGDQPNWSRARLHVQCPLSDEQPNLARATLTLSRGDVLPIDSGPTRKQRLRRAMHRIISRRETAGKDSATQTILQASGDASELHGNEEVRVFDFHRQQFDLLLIGLANCGFFDQQTRPNGGAHLDIKINRGRTAKSWAPEPRLDDLVTRTYQRGRRTDPAM
jgi:hypothetical protein